MATRFRLALYALRSSFWFLPGAMLIVALFLSWFSAWVDLHLNFEIDREAKDWNVWIGPAGARTILNTIAGSMITVTSLVFSMTIIALTMAASNLGPRVIIYFVRDRVTQVSLGLFLATFVYAMLVILVVRDSEQNPFVPYVSLTVAILLAIACFSWLIFFVHRVAHQIQADTIVANIASELSDKISEILETVEEDDDPDSSASRDDASFPEATHTVASAETGYLQFVSHTDILSSLTPQSGYAKILYRPGQFIIRGEPLALVAVTEEAESGGDKNRGDETEAFDALREQIQQAVAIGQKRTMGQDIEFAIMQLVEVGVRALSPGINDFNTAIATIDRLTGALAEAFRKGLPKATHRDDEGEVRLWLRPLTYDGIVQRAFNEIRQCARGNVAVTIRQMEGVCHLIRVARTGAQKKALDRQMESLVSSAKASIEDELDLKDVLERYETYKELIEDQDVND